MRVLVSWLRDFVDVTASPEEIDKTMSVRGFAVEALEHIDWSSPEGSIARADAVIDFEVTGNRPDCMSVMGMAREIATAFGLPIRRPVARGKSNEEEEDGSSLRLASLKAVDKSDIDVVADDMRYLAAPPQLPPTPSSGAGRSLFDSLNCATCHKPMMMTGPNAIKALDRKQVWLFSDLLLHDMGTLGDGIVQSAAGANEFRTAPLWGLRASAPYLHDGRARTMDDAIRQHDGEAKNSRDRYLQLTPQQRQQLLDFLGTI